MDQSTKCVRIFLRKHSLSYKVFNESSRYLETSKYVSVLPSHFQTLRNLRNKTCLKNWTCYFDKYVWISKECNYGDIKQIIMVCYKLVSLHKNEVTFNLTKFFISYNIFFIVFHICLIILKNGKSISWFYKNWYHITKYISKKCRQCDPNKLFIYVNFVTAYFGEE